MTTSHDNLPELPRAWHSYKTSSESDFAADWKSAYTEDQMREYALAAIAAQGGREGVTATPPVDGLRDEYPCCVVCANKIGAKHERALCRVQHDAGMRVTSADCFANPNAEPTKAALTDDMIDRIARSYFAEEYFQKQAKGAIREAIQDAAALVAAAQPSVAPPETVDVQLPQGYEPHEIPADYTGSLYIEGQMRAFYASRANRLRWSD